MKPIPRLLICTIIGAAVLSISCNPTRGTDSEKELPAKSKEPTEEPDVGRPVASLPPAKPLSEAEAIADFIAKFRSTPFSKRSALVTDPDGYAQVWSQYYRDQSLPTDPNVRVVSVQPGTRAGHLSVRAIPAGNGDETAIHIVKDGDGYKLDWFATVGMGLADMKKRQDLQKRLEANLERSRANAAENEKLIDELKRLMNDKRGDDVVRRRLVLIQADLAVLMAEHERLTREAENLIAEAQKLGMPKKDAPIIEDKDKNAVPAPNLPDPNEAEKREREIFVALSSIPANAKKIAEKEFPFDGTATVQDQIKAAAGRDRAESAAITKLRNELAKQYRISLVDLQTIEVKGQKEGWQKSPGKK